ncbi:MAG: phosphoribosylformylglycinamidine synthase [Ruminococcaceae bacterium]|nr:phosphoribosylformylglycinamidine synthase [Oscillospiraceae bacterium]
MVYRIYVEKKEAHRGEAALLLKDLQNVLGIGGLRGLRLVQRYDVEHIDKELFEVAVKNVFSEPQLDDVYDALDPAQCDAAFVSEYLPGQFDQRADSAAQCIELISCKPRPNVRSAKVYLLYGDLTEADVQAIKHYLINPVESREAAWEPYETLEQPADIPEAVETLTGFTALDDEALVALIGQYGFAMDEGDIRFCREYFRSEQRDPTITELRMIDTYWSDHCRHTTFLTTIDSVRFADEELQSAYEDYLAARKELGREKPINLMDIGTIGAKLLKQRGLLQKLDESEEINACTVKIEVDVEGKPEEWLLLFKNETHNHPTEIEPFGGAATCIGGAIRDPLSGRAYVYGAMRVTGAADPTVPFSQTIAGKLPQRKIVTTAAQGYSSYGNQIGLATGQVDEIYHPGYVAKRLEIGAVVGAVPAENVRREVPAPGDVVILLGGRTGRDGCGGATGSSKKHSLTSLETCGAEVQKGNAPEERKLQRLFRNKEASLLIKRCNDFGAGGVSVAIGELADGLEIDLNKVPKKYEGLDGTELAISESQERMAVVVEAKDAARFKALAEEENLEATTVAVVTEAPRLVMYWNGKAIVDVSRDFLNSNGAPKHIAVETVAAQPVQKNIPTDFGAGMQALAGDLNICSKRGLSERFDSTIGARTVLMPFGGKYQQTPEQAMVQTVIGGEKASNTCSLMAWGYNPEIMEKDPYRGAYLAVVESLCKLVAVGGDIRDAYLTFQEYFPSPGKEPKRWGQPLAALLGALKAQTDFGVAAIGGKDSMSGTFEDIDVPPTLVSFAVTTQKREEIVSAAFKEAGSYLTLIAPQYNGIVPQAESLKAVFETVKTLGRQQKLRSAYALGRGGIAEALLKQSIGNRIGVSLAENIGLEQLFDYGYGAFLIESEGALDCGTPIGKTTADFALTYKGETLGLQDLQAVYENKLESVYACNIPTEKAAIEVPAFSAASYPQPRLHTASPRVLIPVFPGTNCEFDSQQAVERAGAKAEIMVINNLSAAGVAESVERFAARLAQSQILFIPGGFSGGDEPEGSGKFITAFLKNPAIFEQIENLLEQRDGLILGICNGFQALIKLGLVPFGKIVSTDAACPTLSFNDIGRHQSRIVRTAVASNKSPWLMATKPGEVYNVPISHGEGKFICSPELYARLAANGQIATQYADESGKPTMDILYNPNGSYCAVEGITSPDGRVLGKMGHSERYHRGLYQNVPGNFDMKLFESAVKYYK